MTPERTADEIAELVSEAGHESSVSADLDDVTLPAVKRTAVFVPDSTPTSAPPPWSSSLGRLGGAGVG